MRPIYKSLALAGILMGIGTSCSSFLDVVPKERASRVDTYADRLAGIRYLYSCYGYLPAAHNTVSGLDLMTGDEVITAFEHEAFAAFPKGNYSASNAVISYWDTFFQGIRQCYMFLDIVDQLPSSTTTNEEKADYKAQAKFLIAYYHYQLLRCYGPISLIKNEQSINMRVNDYPGRNHLDECVEWIANLLDEAAAGLPAKREVQSRFGLATSVAAKAVKAKLYLYAASPLFNGTPDKAPMYANFKDKKDNNLMPTAHDPNKWIKAKEAIKAAISVAETAGHSLYNVNDYRIGEAGANPYPTAGPIRKMRTQMVNWRNGNPEGILMESRAQGYYDIQLKCTPTMSVGSNGANGVSPTWNMLNRFYTKDGLPWNVDPATKNLNPLDIVTLDGTHSEYAHPGKQTIIFNIGREPRFYAWVGFHGGYFEVLNGSDSPYNNTVMPTRGRLILNFLKSGDHGRKDRTNNYAPTGYLNKKGLDPSMTVARAGYNAVDYPWPIIRLADLFLAYAEACVETGDLNEAKLYLNKVRERAGIPTVEQSWETIAGITLDKDKLREIVRQERMIELYLENQNFWDMRRWLLAETYFNQKAKGLNIEGNTMTDFAQLKEVPFERAFDAKKNYLLPIPSSDINRNPQLVQNPGY